MTSTPKQQAAADLGTPVAPTPSGVTNDPKGGLDNGPQMGLHDAAARFASGDKPNQAERIKKMDKKLQKLFPKAFPYGFKGWKPLAVGIKAQIVERMSLTDDEKINDIGLVLAKRTHSLPYLTAVSKGLQRIDLDGNPSGQVTREQQSKAARLVTAMKAEQAKKARAKAIAEGRVKPRKSKPKQQQRTTLVVKKKVRKI